MERNGEDGDSADAERHCPSKHGLRSKRPPFRIRSRRSARHPRAEQRTIQEKQGEGSKRKEQEPSEERSEQRQVALDSRVGYTPRSPCRNQDA